MPNVYTAAINQSV